MGTVGAQHRLFFGGNPPLNWADSGLSFPWGSQYLRDADYKADIKVLLGTQGLWQTHIYASFGRLISLSSLLGLTEPTWLPRSHPSTSAQCSQYPGTRTARQEPAPEP